LPTPHAATTKRRGRRTREFVVGSHDVSNTLSLAVVGMAPGDCTQLTLLPRTTDGPERRGLVRQVSRGRFPQELALRVGMRLTAVHPTSGRRRLVAVVTITSDAVFVDGHQSRKGKAIALEVVLLALSAPRTSDHDAPPPELGGEG